MSDLFTDLAKTSAVVRNHMRNPVSVDKPTTQDLVKAAELPEWASDPRLVNALIGGGVGAGLGALVSDDEKRKRNALIAGLLGGLGGAAYGHATLTPDKADNFDSALETVSDKIDTSGVTADDLANQAFVEQFGENKPITSSLSQAGTTPLGALTIGGTTGLAGNKIYNRMLGNVGLRDSLRLATNPGGIATRSRINQKTLDAIGATPGAAGDTLKGVKPGEFAQTGGALRARAATASFQRKMRKPMLKRLLGNLGRIGVIGTAATAVPAVFSRKGTNQFIDEALAK